MQRMADKTTAGGGFNTHLGFGSKIFKKGGMMKKRFLIRIGFEKSREVLRLLSIVFYEPVFLKV